MDWVKEKKKHDFLDEFEKWINLDEVVRPRRLANGGAKDNINIRVAKNFTLVTNLDMDINGGTIYVPTSATPITTHGVSRYGRTWSITLRFHHQRLWKYEEAREVAPHTLALFLNVAGFTRTYPKFAWAATPQMCPMRIAWRS